MRDAIRTSGAARTYAPRFQEVASEQMVAFVDTMQAIVAAEIAEALVGEKPAEPGEFLKKFTPNDIKRRPSIGQVVAQHMSKVPAKERELMAQRFLTTDPDTGAKLNRARRARVKALFAPASGQHILDRMDPIKVFEPLLSPPRPIKKDDSKSWMAHWTRLTGVLLASGPIQTFPGGAGGTAPQSHSTLELRVHEVECQDDTNELGKDEIAIGSVHSHWEIETEAADPDTTGLTPEFALGQFRTGDSVSLSSPWIAARYTLNGLVYPHRFQGLVVLAETDTGGGFTQFLLDLYEAVEVYLFAIITAVGTAIGAAIGAGAAAGTLAGTLGGPIGALIGAALGAIIGGLVALFTAASRDDIFEQLPAIVDLPSVTATFNGSKKSPMETLTYIGFGGIYHVHYDWKLS